MEINKCRSYMIIDVSKLPKHTMIRIFYPVKFGYPISYEKIKKFGFENIAHVVGTEKSEGYLSFMTLPTYAKEGYYIAEPPGGDPLEYDVNSQLKMNQSLEILEDAHTM